MKLRSSLVIGGFFLGLATALVITSRPAVAASASQHITMSPTGTEISVDPGGTYEGRATVVNQGSDNFAATISIAGYQTKNLTYDPVFKPIDGAPDVTKWITIDSGTDFKNVKPHQVLDIRYTLRVPEDTPPGGYYAVLFATAVPVATPDQGVIHRNQVGNILYITVDGPMTRSGSVSAEPVSPISFGGPVIFPAVVANTGTVHFKTTYRVHVTSLFGDSVFTSATPAYVLPHTKRAVQAEWRPDSPFGVYKVVRTSTLPSGEKKLADSWVVVINPLLLVGVVLLIIAVILWLVTRRKKRQRRK